MYNEIKKILGSLRSIWTRVVGDLLPEFSFHKVTYHINLVSFALFLVSGFVSISTSHFGGPAVER